MKKTWIVYMVTNDGRYNFRRIEAESYADAQQVYSVVGLNIFVWAEPLDKCPLNAAIGLSHKQIEDRLKAAGRLVVCTDAKVTNAALSRTSGPRKPIPIIVAEVHNATPVDADRAWAAVVAACKGTS
jgi:hypothetical protein